MLILTSFVAASLNFVCKDTFTLVSAGQRSARGKLCWDRFPDSGGNTRTAEVTPVVSVLLLVIPVLW
ncbi:hypothetical protein HF325_000369 [Metschnikowia pulcherrima]|uniref:Uncharacterized protein n=1 Tax=Metschnikowia pulcherrima TaxID=27326 RepID=A0A8H7GY68_9ASCO|nr:hypothetical protein HF325_000369 [Metschnikowia pulcherrima]